jgi:hypothetical protein
MALVYFVLSGQNAFPMWNKLAYFNKIKARKLVERVRLYKSISNGLPNYACQILGFGKWLKQMASEIILYLQWFGIWAW